MNQENRKLPTIDLAGAEFYVDAKSNVLIDTRNSSNTIHPHEALVLEDHFEIVFDKQTRNLKESDWTNIDDDRYAYIWLRPLGVYDPEGAKEKRSADDLERLASLPTIDIEGTKFLWEDRTSLLLQKDNPWNTISRNDLELRNGVAGIYFDKEKKVVPFPHEMPSDKTIIPNHISFVLFSEINKEVLRAKQQKPQHNPSQKKGRKIK